MKKLAPVLLLFWLASLAILACSVIPAPPVRNATRSATPSIQVQRALVATFTPTLEPAPPTSVKPTATFVPLITPSPTADITRVSVIQAKAKIDAGEAVIIDVRAAETYQQNHIAGALSMPANEVAERYTELPSDALVVFYCA